LTRRANQAHIFIIAKIEPAPGNRRGLFESGEGCRHISFVPPQFRSPVPWGVLKGTAMKKLLVAALVAASFISFEARAQNRAGDAALGAVSGAVVLGPVGAVAGAVIGYTAGPAIAHSWGAGRSAPRPRARRAAQSDPATRRQAAAEVSASPPEKTPEAVADKKTAPPVQGFD
jgi:hypothetical protein